MSAGVITKRTIGHPDNNADLTNADGEIEIPVVYAGQDYNLIFDLTGIEDGTPSSVIYDKDTDKFVAIRNTYDATTAPTVNNDVSQGYRRGSRYYDTVLGDLYECADPTTGAAVWINLEDLALNDLASVAISGDYNDLINTPTGLTDKAANETISGDWTFSGAVSFTGSTVIVDAEIVTADAVIAMNDGELGTGVTLGFSGQFIDRGSLNPYFFGFDETRDAFVVGEITELTTAQIATTQVIATRVNNPGDGQLSFWDAANKRLNFTSNLYFENGPNTNQNRITISGEGAIGNGSIEIFENGLTGYSFGAGKDRIRNGGSFVDCMGINTSRQQSSDLFGIRSSLANGEDTGSVPMFVLETDVFSSSKVSTRPLLAFNNYDTKVFEISAIGSWNFQNNDLIAIKDISISGNISQNNSGFPALTMGEFSSLAYIGGSLAAGTDAKGLRYAGINSDKYISYSAQISGSQDSGSIPLVQFVSSFLNGGVGSSVSNRPLLAGYNYTNKVWEVAADGTWDYQGNNLSNIGSIQGPLSITGTPVDLTDAVTRKTVFSTIPKFTQASTFDTSGESAFPRGIAFYDDEIYISDRTGDSIEVYDTSGVHQRSFGNGTTCDGPSQIAINPANGKLYVFATDDFYIRVFDAATGTHQSSEDIDVSSFSANLGWGLMVDFDNDRIYISEFQTPTTIWGAFQISDQTYQSSDNIDLSSVMGSILRSGIINDGICYTVGVNTSGNGTLLAYNIASSEVVAQLGLNSTTDFAAGIVLASGKLVVTHFDNSDQPYVRFFDPRTLAEFHVEKLISSTYNALTQLATNPDQTEVYMTSVSDQECIILELS